jgi:hypothetical protein
MRMCMRMRMRLLCVACLMYRAVTSDLLVVTWYLLPLVTRVRTDYLLCQVYYESLEKSMPLYNALGKLGL